MRARFIGQLEPEIDCALCRCTGRSWYSVASSLSTPSDCSRRARMTSVRGMHPAQAARSGIARTHRFTASGLRVPRAAQQMPPRGNPHGSTRPHRVPSRPHRVPSMRHARIGAQWHSVIMQQRRHDRAEVCRRGDLRQRPDRFALLHRSVTIHRVLVAHGRWTIDFFVAFRSLSTLVASNRSRPFP